MTQEQKRFIEKLYARKYEMLYHYAYTVLQDRSSAENMVNNTFLDAIKKVDQLLKHENPEGWLTHALKLQIKHEQFLKSQQPTLLALDSVQEQFSQESKLKDAEGGLLDEEREFYELYFKMRFSHKELSEHYGISISASQKRLERIRKKLKTMLKE